MENYYLNLLYKKNLELENVLKEIDNCNLPIDYKKYLIAGYIIALDSILEKGIGNLHSYKFDEVTSLIYHARQKVLHLGYFNGLDNIEETANTIVKLVQENYDEEKKYFDNTFKDKIKFQNNNIVIKDSPNITFEPPFFKFKSDDGEKLLCIPAKNIFTLTKGINEHIDSYIINLDKGASLYIYKNGHPDSYREIEGDEIKNFLKENFIILRENYNTHIQVMNDIIDKFLTDPLNTTRITAYNSKFDDKSDTIEVIKNFIIERTMCKSHLKYFLSSDTSINKLINTNHSHSLRGFKYNAIRTMNDSDVFFVRMTLERANYYFNQVDVLDPKTDPQVIKTIFIQLFESGPKYFSDHFIKCNYYFEKIYSILLKYRNIFSHLPLEEKKFIEGLDSFKKEFLEFIALLKGIDFEKVRRNVNDKYRNFVLIEREKSDFFNYKHEQFLKIDEDNYIGRKIYYSSKNPKSDKLIAVIPNNSQKNHIQCYKKDCYGNLTPIKSDADNDTYTLISNHLFDSPKKAKIDLELSALFKANRLLKRANPNKEIRIYFQACESNDYYEHNDSLDNVILRFFSQGYLPTELLQKITLDTSQSNLGLLTLLDEDNNIIAKITNNKKYFNEQTSKKDPLDFFSRIDSISHKFNKRRHVR